MSDLISNFIVRGRPSTATETEQELKSALIENSRLKSAMRIAAREIDEEIYESRNKSTKETLREISDDLKEAIS